VWWYGVVVVVVALVSGELATHHDGAGEEGELVSRADGDTGLAGAVLSIDRV
jgi:hypothetical protein